VRTKGGDMSHNVRISDNLWPLLAAEAGKRITTPSRLTDLAIRRELGLEPTRIIIEKEEKDGENC